MGNDREEIQEFKVKYRVKEYKINGKAEWNNSPSTFTREEIYRVNERGLLNKKQPIVKWKCPLDDPECTRNCGRYGCGN
jgi:hypothetical protein